MSLDWFPPPVLAPLAGSESYRSPRARLAVLRVLLGVTSLGAGAYAAIAVRALLIDDWATAAGRRANETADSVGCAVTLSFYITYVALAVWTGRSYRNLRALGVSDLRFTPGWGLGAWFVPFLNFVRPKQIVDELWRGSNAGDRGPVPRALHVWWALWLLALLLAPQGDPETRERAVVAWGLVGAALILVSSSFTCWVTSALTNRLECLADGRDDQQRPARARRRIRGPLAVAGLAAAGMAAGAVVPGIATKGPVSVGELVVGDCFGDPTVDPPTIGEEVATVDVASCDVPHAYELIDVMVHDSPPDATYPGQEHLFQFAVEECVTHFEAIVGTPFMQSELDVFAYVPTADGWRDGDRVVQCMALRIDGRPLEGTVVGTGQ